MTTAPAVPTQCEDHSVIARSDISMKIPVAVAKIGEVTVGLIS